MLAPESVEVMLPLVFVYDPAVFPLTLTEKLQLVAPAERVPPVIVIRVELAVAVMV